MLAKHSQSEGEASNAMAAANKLAEKYRIEIASLELTGDNTSPVEEIIEDTNPIISGGRIRYWKTILLNAIFESQGCDCIFKRNSRSHSGITSYYAFGRPSDIAIARNMFDFAVNQLDYIGKLVCVGKGKVYANSWYNGAVDGISQGLMTGKEKARRDAMQLGMTAALTVVDNRHQESKDATRRAYPRLRTVSIKRNNIAGSAYNDGKKVGSRMNVSGTKLLGG